MATISPAERSYIITGLSHPDHPTRQDGRSPLTPRPIQISYGDAPQASGSSRVVIGDGTEVIAGIRLEVVDVDPKAKGKGKEGWRASIEVDITPQAYPAMTSQALQQLSTIYASLINDHFIPSIPALPILPPTKYFVPQVHLTLLSASSGSALTALVLAARAAFSDLHIPRTKKIGWEGAADEATQGGDLAGMKAALQAGKGGKGKAKGRRPRGGDDWELDTTDGGLEYLQGREELPVLVTLNLVSGSQAFFIDATTQEELACTDRLHLFFNSSGKLCGMRSEGTEGTDLTRFKPLLMEGKRIALELIESLNGQLPQEL